MLSTGQGRRMFGYIAGGGTLGGLVGSQVAGRLVGEIGVANLLLIPAGLLLAALLVYLLLERSMSQFHQGEDLELSGKATGGNPFAGFTSVFKSGYLLAICGYGLFMATCGTTVYFQQSEIVSSAYDHLDAEPAKEAKTEYFANINFAVSLVTLLMQFVIVGLLMKHAGLGITLTVLPITFMIGIGCLAVWPSIVRQSTGSPIRLEKCCLHPSIEKTATKPRVSSTRSSDAVAIRALAPFIRC